MKVTVKAVFPHSFSSAETDKTLKGAVKTYVATMKEKLSDALGVDVSIASKFAEGRKPTFSTKVTIRNGGKNNVVIAGIVVFDKDATKPNGGQFDSKALIACNGTSVNLSRWCKKVGTEPKFNLASLKAMAKKFAKESGATVKPKTPTGSPPNSAAKEAKSLFFVLDKAGLKNISIEQHSMLGEGADVIWRAVGVKDGYAIRVDGLKHGDTSFSIEKCKGPGVPKSAEFTSRVKVVIGDDELKAFFDKLTPPNSNEAVNPTLAGTPFSVKPLLNEISVKGARKKLFSAKDLVVEGMTTKDVAAQLRKLVTKGTLEKGEMAGTYRVAVTPASLKKLISTSRSKHRSHSSEAFSKSEILAVVKSKFPDMYQDFNYCMDDYADDSDKDDTNWSLDDIKHVITRFSKEFGPLEVIVKLRKAFKNFL